MNKVILSALLILGFLAMPSLALATYNFSFVSNTACYNSRRLTNAALNCYDTDLRVRYRVKNSGDTSWAVIVYSYDLMGTQIKSAWSPYFFGVNAYSYVDKSMSIRGVFCKGVELRLVPGWYKNPETDFVGKWRIANNLIKPCQ